MFPIQPAIYALLLFASSRVYAEDPVPSPETWLPSPEALLVHAALSERDAGNCTLIDTLTPTPVSTLLEVVDHATMPPWAPVRATECLVMLHPQDIRDRMLLWVKDPDTRGLASVVYRALDTLPLDLSTEVATAALTGADPNRVKRYLRKSARPELKTLVGD